MVTFRLMNNKEVQAKIAILEQKGWTLINIARALGLKGVTIESWKAGIRSPANLLLVINALDDLVKQKPPKKKIYTESGRQNGVSNG
jgi:transcriptional regulator with XRE-family HTH domain